MEVLYIVEDDKNIRELIAYALNNNGFKAYGFPDAKKLYARMEKKLPSLLILDIMLEDIDGYSVLAFLKEQSQTSHIPVIMLTAKDSEFDKVKGLDMGADDYIIKPFGVMELISRVRAVLRRAPKPDVHSDAKIYYQDITMDLEKRLAYISGRKLELTYKEFELLYYLIQNKGIVLTRDKIMSEIWGFDYQGESRTVDVHIRTLRQKLGENKFYIKTIRNVGYMIDDLH